MFFFVVSPSAAWMWQPAANTQKKRSCELAKYSASTEEKKRGNMWERGRWTVSTHTKPRKITTIAKWAGWQPYHGQHHRWVVYHNISANMRAQQVYHLALGCFCTSDLYQHLNPILNSWHQKVIHEVASYILFETWCKYDTPPKLSTSTWFISSHQFLNGTVS